MASITTIHHSLPDVNSGAGEVRPIVHVFDLIDWTAVNSHADADVLLFAQRRAYFQRATDRLLRAVEKEKYHSIARGKPN